MNKKWNNPARRTFGEKEIEEAPKEQKGNKLSHNMQRAKLAKKIVEMMAEAQQRMAKGRAEKCKTSKKELR